jgi:hypothetical protein
MFKHFRLLSVDVKEMLAVLLFGLLHSCQKFTLEQYLTLSNPIFLSTAYSPVIICFGRERGWWITCDYPTVLNEKIMQKQKEYNLRYLLAKARTT